MDSSIQLFQIKLKQSDVGEKFIPREKVFDTLPTPNPQLDMIVYIFKLTMHF